MAIKSSLYRPLVLILWLVGAPGALFAERVSLTLHVNPRQPDSQDVVSFRTFGYTQRSCVPKLDSFTVDREARVVTIVGRRSTTGCEDVDEPITYRLEGSSSILEPGDWEFVAKLPDDDYVNTKVFTVTSAGKRGAGDRTAASLLIPYFHVDLEKASGLTTLLAIGNSSSEEALAHVVVWTDWGVPTLAFDLHLSGDAVETINLRDLFQRGQLPVTGADNSFPGCTRPVALPRLGYAELGALRAQHTGQPDPADGLCYGSTRRDPDVAVGFVTVDLLDRCPAGFAYPLQIDDSGSYFGARGPGLASSRNVLFGDFFFVDSEGDHAQGFEAVALPADSEVGASRSDRSFYGGGMREIIGDNRTPLPARYRTRFLSGGPFDGNTSLIVWRWTIWFWDALEGPRECGAAHGDCYFLDFSFYDESGTFLETHSLGMPGPREVTAIYEVGGEELPVSSPFGSVVVQNLELVSCLQIPAGVAEHSAWVIPLVTAEGRYSVGFRATPLQ